MPCSHRSYMLNEHWPHAPAICVAMQQQQPLNQHSSSSRSRSEKSNSKNRLVLIGFVNVSIMKLEMVIVCRFSSVPFYIATELRSKIIPVNIRIGKFWTVHANWPQNYQHIIAVSVRARACFDQRLSLRRFMTCCCCCWYPANVEFNLPTTKNRFSQWNKSSVSVFKFGCLLGGTMGMLDQWTNW